MAVCNLFKELTSPTGNFLMFSQYVEDLTHNYVENDTWKVVPTRFVALDIDYKSLQNNATFKRIVLNNGKETMNTGIPKYFQNCFENACAYGRVHYKDWTSNNLTNQWTSEIARNLFWNYMFDGGFITARQYGTEANNVQYIPEVKYYGDISMHSYNEHQGMGYGEIYCYIPSDAEQMNCQVVRITDEDINARLFDSSNSSRFLEGYANTYPIEDYPQIYYYNRDFTMSFDDPEVGKLLNATDSKYNINTIVVLYSVFEKINDTWEVVHANIPMGMYITGKFDSEGITNSVTKYVTTSYGSGTSYGLRICTRFTASQNGTLYNTDIVSDDAGYNNVCQLMTAMSENLTRMLDVVKSSNNTTQQYKDMLTIINNNRTNVPYVKNVNGTDCWFVNGKMIATVTQGTNLGCGTLSPDTVQQRIDDLLDNNPDNDYSYIDDPNGMNYIQIPSAELAENLGLNPDEFKDPTYESADCTCNIYEEADNDTIKDMLEIETELDGNEPIPEEPETPPTEEPETPPTETPEDTPTEEPETPPTETPEDTPTENE
jgi:hypothetical protein